MWQTAPELLKVSTSKCHVTSCSHVIGQHKSHLHLALRREQVRPTSCSLGGREVDGELHQ